MTFTQAADQLASVLPVLQTETSYQAGQAFMRDRVADVLRSDHPDLAALVLKLPLLGESSERTCLEESLDRAVSDTKTLREQALKAEHIPQGFMDTPIKSHPAVFEAPTPSEQRETEDSQRSRDAWADEIRRRTKAEAALHALEARVGWQPIDTAPKDGTKVDLWAKVWLPAFDRFEYRRFADCWWWNGSDFGNKAAWMELSKDWCPTHWMPLPDPPASSVLK